MVKPFSPQEVVARVKSMLRRNDPGRASLTDVLVLAGGDLEIDTPAHRVRWQNRILSLTPTEFNLLLYLAKHPGRVFSRAQLAEAIFGYDSVSEDRAVDIQQDLDYAETYQYELGHNDTRVGSLIIAHPLETEGSAWLQQDIIFQRTLTRSLLWTGLIAISAALVLGILFSRRLSRPLEDFARAATRITSGDYFHHLPSYNSRELNDLALCFNQMSLHLEELEKLRKRSVADISHELRTPLTTLRSYIEAIKDGVISADEKTLGILSEEIMHLNRVAVDMDELARAESTRLEQVEREKINLNQFLTDKTASFKPLFQEKGVNLDLRLPETDLIIFMEPGALGKITGNLLDNAYRYTEPGGTVTLDLQENAELDPAAVPPLGQESLEDEDTRNKLSGMYMITVSDTGKGIKPEHLPYIFERFFRADPSREREQKQSGSGTGLALVKELVRSAGGFILASSRPGEGTTFYLYLK